MRVQPVHALHQLANGVDDGAELDADRPVFTGRLDDHGKVEVVREIEPTAVALGEYGRMDAMEREDLLRNRLVLRQHQAVGARTGVPFPDQIEERRDLEVRGVVIGKRLGQVENQIAVEARQCQQALGVAVQLVEHRVVTQLAEDFGDFVLYFLLIERPDDRRLLDRSRRLFVFNEHTVIENDDFQFAHAAPDNGRALTATPTSSSM